MFGSENILSQRRLVVLFFARRCKADGPEETGRRMKDSFDLFACIGLSSDAKERRNFASLT